MAERTKLWIAEAMKRLMAKTTLDKIRVTEICRERGCPLHIARFGAIEPLEASLAGQTFRYRGAVYSLPLLGEYPGSGP